MSSVVAVAGGSGGLGRAIVDHLKADGRYVVVILGRKTSAQLEEATGARVLAADYSSSDALVSLLEDNNVSTVISTMNTMMDKTPELNLIQAADRAKTTHRFIPNIWSAVVYGPEHVKTFPFAVGGLQLIEALKKTSLKWTAIYPGFFLEYFVAGLPTHLTPHPMMVDVKGKAAAIPGSGDTPISFTYSADIGTYVAALLGFEEWEQEYRIVGDTKTWNEILALAEKGVGVKFDVSYDAVEQLGKGLASELPIYKEAYKMFPGGEAAAKPMVLATMAQFGLWQHEGQFDLRKGTLLNNALPEIKTLSLEDAWKQVAGRSK